MLERRDHVRFYVPERFDQNKYDPAAEAIDAPLNIVEIWAEKIHLQPITRFQRRPYHAASATRATIATITIHSTGH